MMFLPIAVSNIPRKNSRRWGSLITINVIVSQKSGKDGLNDPKKIIMIFLPIAVSGIPSKLSKEVHVLLKTGL